VETVYYAPLGEITSFKRGANLYQVHADALGSVRKVTDSSGVEAAAWSYGAWGQELDGSGPLEGAISTRFVGGLGVRTDASASLIWMRNRWYDPVLGRFLSKDPSRNSANSYSYVANQPTSNIDPLGLYDIQVDGWTIRVRPGDPDILPGVPHGHIVAAPQTAFVGKKVDLITGEILEVAGRGRAGSVIGHLPSGVVDTLRRTSPMQGGLMGRVIKKFAGRGNWEYLDALSRYGGNLLMLAAIGLALSRVASADPCDRSNVAEGEATDWVTGELIAAGAGAALRSGAGRAAVAAIVRAVATNPAAAASIVAAGAGWAAGIGIGNLPVGGGQTVDSNLQWVLEHYVFDYSQDVLVTR